MDNSIGQGMADMAKGMDEKIEAAAEMNVREEDLGAGEMAKKMADLAKGMDEKIEAVAEMKVRKRTWGHTTSDVDGGETMFARVGIAQDQPGKMDDAVRVYRDSVAPAQKQQKGFKGAFFLTDRHTGRSISISLWDTEADMEASMASGFYQAQTAKFAQDFEGKPVWEEYEVSVQV